MIRCCLCGVRNWYCGGVTPQGMHEVLAVIVWTLQAESWDPVVLSSDAIAVASPETKHLLSLTSPLFLEADSYILFAGMARLQECNGTRRSGPTC